MRELGSRLLVANFAGTFGRQLGGALLALAITTIIARLYGPAGNGTFAVLLLLPTALSTALSLGIAAANVYLVGSGASSAREALRANVHLGLWLSALGLAIGALLIATRAEALFPGVPLRLLWLALPLYPLALASGFLGSIAQALENFRVYNQVLLVQPALMVAGLVLLGAAGHPSLEVLVALQVVTQALATLIAAVAVRRILPARREPAAPRPLVYCGKALSYGWKAHLGGLLSFLNYKADIFLVNYFLNPAAAGLYVIAVSLAEKLWMVSTAASTVLLPRLSQLAREEDVRNSLTAGATRIVLLVTCAGALVLAACAYPVVHLLFGRDYDQCTVPLLLLLPGIALLGGARVLANDLAARGRPETNTYLSVVTLVVNLAANVGFIPTFGLAGAAAATTIAYTFCAAATLAAYVRISGTSWSDSIVPKNEDFRAVARFVGGPRARAAPGAAPRPVQTPAKGSADLP